MLWKRTEAICSLTIVGCWAFGMLAIIIGYDWRLSEALLSVPAFTITAVCLTILVTKLIIDHVADNSPVFQDEIDGTVDDGADTARA